MPQVLCPVLIGRSDEVEQLGELLVEARGGSGRLAFVVGEAGIGKTRLLRETQTRARDLRMKVLTGRAVPGGTRIPFRPLVEAVQSWTRVEGVPDDPALRPHRSALGWLIPEWRPKGSVGASPVMMLEAVVRLLRVMAENGGLLLSLDDLQWADADSLSMVEYLADNLASVAVLCLCALRSDEEGPAGLLAERLTARRAASRIALHRLGDRHVDEMIRTALPSVADAKDLGAVRARAEGVPFVVEEMLSAYLTSGTLTLPASYRELVRARMAVLDAEARGVIQAAAAIGRDFDWTVVAAITNLGRDAVLAALRAAITSQLIRSSSASDDPRFSFRHALIQEAILEDLLPPERLELFLRVARALEETFPGLPGDLCQVAADLRERAGDRTDATRLLLEIARRAIGATALGTAEAALRRALELGEGDRWRTMGVHRLLVQVLALSGKTEGLREIGEAVLGFFQDRSFMGGPLQFSDLHLQIARGLASAGDEAMVERHLGRARHWAERGGHAQQLARIDAFRAHVLIGNGVIAEADGLAASALQRGLELGLDDAVCEALRAEGRIAFMSGDAERAVRVLERGKLVADRADLALERTLIHLALSRIDRSTTTDLANADKARELSERTGAVAVRAAVDLEIARLHIERFELDAAAEAAEHSASVCRRYGLALLPWAQVTQAQVLALSTKRQEMERTLDDVLGRAIGPEAAAVALGEARAILHLLREERAPALDALKAAVDRAGRASDPWPFHGTHALLRVLEGEGFEDAARSLAGSGVLAHAANRGLFIAAEAVHLGREGQARGAVERAAEALEVLRPFVWRRPLALRLLAEAALAAGWGEPARWADEALLFFGSAGRERVAAACRGLLRRAGVRVSREGRGDSVVPARLAALGITSREVDVLNLVAEGLSNAEIAARLFVSIRTVETHASRLLRKARVESRPQLVAFANRFLDQATAP
jgi:DNA-binding CsgD family transcriptional regulator